MIQSGDQVTQRVVGVSCNQVGFPCSLYYNTSQAHIHPYIHIHTYINIHIQYTHRNTHILF